MMDKIYTEGKILTGVLVGGPLGGGYLLWRTCKSLGKPAYASAVAIGAAVVTVLLFGLLFVVPAVQRLPTFLFPAIQIGLATGFIKAVLSESISEHVQALKPVFGWLNTILVSVAFLVLTLVAFLSLFFIAPSVFDSTATRTYGKLNHEIHFDAGNISEREVDQIGDALTSAGFFDEQYQKAVDVAKQGSRYVITVYCNESVRNDAEIQRLFAELRDDVQKSFPRNHIIIDLVGGIPDDRIARIE